MTQARLPDGFAVQVDRRVRVLGQGSALLGGSPTRILRLAPAAQDMLADGRLKVRDAVSAELARTLLDATVAHPRPAGGPSHRDVTVVIPVRDNAFGLRRLVHRVARPADRRRRRRLVDADHARRLRRARIRHRGSAARAEQGSGRGPQYRPRRLQDGLSSPSWTPTSFRAAAGWRRCSVTSATRPWHWSPRGSSGLAQTDHLVARYEAVRSSLDLGQREAPVIPYTSVSYVPSAAIICRTSTLRDIGGFDETLRSGEDVDLCWRLVEAGARLRYEPIAQVAHDHRTELRDWVARKAFYGGSAAPLSVRHPDKIAPLMISGMGADGVDPDGHRLELRLPGVAVRRRAHRSSDREKHAGHRDPDVGRSGGGRPQPVVGGDAAGVGDLPALLAGRVAGGRCLFRPCRRVVLVAAVVDGVVDWASRRQSADDDASRSGC